MSRLTNKLSGGILGLLLVMITLVSCTPILGKPTYYVGVGIVMAIVIVANLFAKCYQRNILLVLSVYSYIALIFVYRFLGISDAEWGNYVHQLYFFVAILIMLLMHNKLSYRQKRWVLWLMIGVMIFNIGDNIRLAILYPNINVATRITFDESILNNINMGGNSFYTFSLMFFNVCFFIFLNCQRKAIKYVMLCCAILTGVYICGYCFKATVVLYFIFSVILLYYAKKVKNISRTIIIGGILGVFLLIFINIFSSSLIEFIKEVSPNKRLTERFITLIDSNDVEANEKTVSGRTTLYMLSIKTWLANPCNFFFGIGDHRLAHGAASTGIGQHSDLLDSLARYGIIGLIILCVIFKKSFDFILSLFEQRYRPQLIVFFFILLLCGGTKGIFFPSMGCTFFLLLPLASVYVNQQNSLG